MNKDFNPFAPYNGTPEDRYSNFQSNPYKTKELDPKVRAGYDDYMSRLNRTRSIRIINWNLISEPNMRLLLGLPKTRIRSHDFYDPRSMSK